MLNPDTINRTSATLNLTDDQIRAAMIPADLGDFYITIARLEKAAAERQSAKVGQAPAMIEGYEPTAEAVAAEVRRRGCLASTAREDLIAASLLHGSRLARVSPASANEVNAALDRAAETKLAAERLLEDRQSAVAGLEQAIFRLGNIRIEIQRLGRLRIDKPSAKALAEQALEFFLLKESSPSPENQGGWKSSLEALAFRKTLEPYLAEYIERFENQAAELIAEIRTTAAEEKIDLAELMKLLRSESGKRPGVNLIPNSEIYAGIL